MGQILYAQGSGNASAIDWNTAADGSGDSAPWGDHAEDDTLEANGFTVELDAASFVRALLQNTSGEFTVALGTVGPREFVCDIMAIGNASNNHCVKISGSPHLLTVIGNVLGSATTASNGINSTGAGSARIEGNVTGGTAANARGISLDNVGLIEVLGDVTGGNQNASYGIRKAWSGTVIVHGTIRGGAWSSSGGLFSTTNTGIMVAYGSLDNTQSAAISGYLTPFTWRPKPGSCIIQADGSRIFPAQATGILGVGV